MLTAKTSSALIVVILIGATIFIYGNSQINGNPPNFDDRGKIACIEPESYIKELHWHQDLTIIINGQKATIPPDVGIEPTCHRVLHTHDETGRIHLEPNKPDTFYLGDFFAVWGKTFNGGQILDKKIDSNHDIIMTVNGVRNYEFENLILQDGQQIRIEYKRRN